MQLLHFRKLLWGEILYPERRLQFQNDLERPPRVTESLYETEQRTATELGNNPDNPVISFAMPPKLQRQAASARKLLFSFSFLLFAITLTQETLAQVEFDQISPSSMLFRVVYTCENANGSGCSAGCASASFSPLTELIVTLYSIQDREGKNTEILHYSVKFPEAAKPEPKVNPALEIR
jgi:hypothetical protein